MDELEERPSPKGDCLCKNLEYAYSLQIIVDSPANAISIAARCHDCGRRQQFIGLPESNTLQPHPFSPDDGLTAILVMVPGPVQESLEEQEARRAAEREAERTTRNTHAEFDALLAEAREPPTLN